LGLLCVPSLQGRHQLGHGLAQLPDDQFRYGVAAFGIQVRAIGLAVRDGTQFIGGFLTQLLNPFRAARVQIHQRGILSGGQFPHCFGVRSQAVLQLAVAETPPAKSGDQKGLGAGRAPFGEKDCTHVTAPLV